MVAQAAVRAQGCAERPAGARPRACQQRTAFSSSVLRRLKLHRWAERPRRGSSIWPLLLARAPLSGSLGLICRCRINARRDITAQAAQTDTATAAAPAAAPAPAAATATAGAAFSFTSFECNAFRVQFPNSGAQGGSSRPPSRCPRRCACGWNQPALRNGSKTVAAPSAASRRRQRAGGPLAGGQPDLWRPGLCVRRQQA